MEVEKKRGTLCCNTSIEDCINSRRCFMTGEYCSKQMNIQRERKKLHEKNHINAFVVMNFSNMSDVVYKWRLKSFIESLTKYLYIDKKRHKLYCYPHIKLLEKERVEIEKEKRERVEEIHVIRADSDPASNYVICNRVCQQMQIADLIVVDVSMENTNVFYEFGMAVALGKLILPICYSESFYKMEFPEGIIKQKQDKRAQLEHHIDCYPWRRALFEYYGIRYRSAADSSGMSSGTSDSATQYLDFSDAIIKEYGFTDLQYDRFPYDEVIEVEESGGVSNNIEKVKIGEKIYKTLQETYNGACYEHNTLIVYTMDGFLNETQAGQCIINFYENITRQMREEQCFCGERVGVLIQGNAIPEDVKDARKERKLLYSVGEIIHIGMNQATYIAQQEKIKTEDFLTVDSGLMEAGEAEDEKWEDEIQRFVKEHIRNKSISIYPNNPVYVNRIKNGLQKGILEKTESKSEDENEEFSVQHFFCLYHVMLRTLKYTNEIVVDISKNSLQALFWLGAAHGSDIYAITVQHEQTEEERAATAEDSEKKERNIFDVAGLWTAVLHSRDTEGFYRQLALAQLGIEQHTKLKLKHVEYYEEKLKEQLYEEHPEQPDENRQEIQRLLRAKKEEEERVLESYYRDRFWKPMLRYNRLWIYLPQVDSKDEKDGEPRLHTAKWDVDAIAALSHYLSKRKIIGEYQFKTLGLNIADQNAGNVNFICVGDAARPLESSLEGDSNSRGGTESLAEYIFRQLKNGEDDTGPNYNVIHKRVELAEYECSENTDSKRIYKGFACFGDSQHANMFTQLPQSNCYKCMSRTTTASEQRVDDNEPFSLIYHSADEVENKECSLKREKNNQHLQLAQLVLWREVPEAGNDRVYFRVALNGVSGPATMALASIFVDDDQKEEIFSLEGNDTLRKNEEEGTLEIQKGSEASVGRDLLNKLQEKIRRRFMKIYFCKLKEAINNLNLEFSGDEANSADRIEQKQAYCERVKYAAGMYLSTVLYRYFLPFLSLEDEYRICNGMRIYVASMKAAGVSPFCLNYPSDGDTRYKTSVTSECVEAVADLVISILQDTLKNFRGVEAFYQVQVIVVDQQRTGMDTQQEVKSDTRKVIGIQELEGNESVNCLFYF